ncbi:hypothetical protein SAMN05428984_3423 [Sphingomonas sp. OK281]|nr:hypothetical protein SAMN05428984_3423 [Sphingomonas sp. OK281]
MDASMEARLHPNVQAREIEGISSETILGPERRKKGNA